MCVNCDYVKFRNLVRDEYGYSVVSGNYLSVVERDGLISLLKREKLGVLVKAEKDILERHIMLRKVVRL